MKQLKYLTLLLVPAILGTSCSKDFNWDPDPYVGDSISQTLVNGEGLVIRSDEPRFDRMTCFPPENIAALRSAIREVRGEHKAKVKEAMKVLDTSVWYAKQEKKKRD